MIGLPLAIRLRRAVLIALLLGLWAPGKIVWERSIAREQDLLRYHGVSVTPHLRDLLGQGLTIGVLSGMGSVVADFLWIYNVTLDWEGKHWFEIESYINLCTTLQPRSIVFWSIGGWQLAWNASVDANRNLAVPELQRLKASRFWIEKGLDVYKRGIQNNPERYRLWADTGLLYQMRKADQEKRLGMAVAAAADYKQAAYYYEQALQRPDCPIFYERFPAYMLENAGDDQGAYDYWRKLWFKLTPAEKRQPQHAADKIEANIRKLEEKLAIPKEKRVFPNG